MEEDNETQSRPSRNNSLSPDPPIGAKTEVTTITTTAKSSASSLPSVASPRNQTITGGRRSGGGGGRDDCWSEEATEILIDAWGERFTELKRGNLKQQHWKEVAEIVNHSNCMKTPKTDIQCKNRIDTVKKKFKQEKAKIAAGEEDDSKWIFFKKLQDLIGETVTPLSSRASLYQRKAKFKQQGGGGDEDSTRWHFRKRVASETESESEFDSGEDSLPPLLTPPVKKVDRSGGGGREVGEVAMAILGFAESFEKVEGLKIKQMVELEKERMVFAKEIQLQRMEFFKTQMEMLRNVGEDRDGERGIRRSHHSVKDNGNVS